MTPSCLIYFLANNFNYYLLLHSSIHSSKSIKAQVCYFHSSPTSDREAVVLVMRQSSSEVRFLLSFGSITGSGTYYVQRVQYEFSPCSQMNRLESSFLQVELQG